MRNVSSGIAAVVVLALGLGACSGSQTAGSAVVPSAQGAGAPMMRTAGSSPAQTSYAVTQTTDTQTWNGPTGKPATSKTSDTGTASVSLSQSTGTSGTNFTMTTNTSMKSGATEHFVLQGSLVYTGSSTDEYFYSDTYNGTDAAGLGSIYSGKDTFPDGELGAVFPLSSGSTWDSTGNDKYSIDNTQYTGAASGKPVGDEDAGTFNQVFTGYYSGNDTWTNTQTKKREYSERFGATAPTALSYVLSLPGYSNEDWTFAPPSKGAITVTASAKGKAPFPTGAQSVADWYPDKGKLPNSLIVDRLKVMPGTVTAPSGCNLSSPVSEVQETWSILDPVAGSYSYGTNDYYGWSSEDGFPQCVAESSTQELIANGNWYVSWLTGKPYYVEKATLLEAPSSTSAGRRALVATGFAPRMGLPIQASTPSPRT